MGRLTALRRFAAEHSRLLAALQLLLLAAFLGVDRLGGARLAPRRRRTTSATRTRRSSRSRCLALGGYYLVFVLGWMRILDDWGVRISYPAALRAEMVSMLAKYVPGGVWTPAARVVAARRAGVTDAALVTASMLLEAGISAVAGVIVFVVSLACVDGVHAPLAPLIVVRRSSSRCSSTRGSSGRSPHASCAGSATGGSCRSCAATTLALLLVFYSGTWVLGGLALWLLLRSVGAHPDAGRDRLPRRDGCRRGDRRGARSSSRRPGSARARRRCTG